MSAVVFHTWSLLYRFLCAQDCGAAQTSANAASFRVLLYGFGGGFNRSQWSTHFTVLTSTLAFLCPEKVMSGRMSRVCVPLATLKEQLKLIFCTPRSLHPVWSSASVRLMVLSYTWSARCDGSSATVSGMGDLIFTLS